jgi:hypothetical protein
VNTNDPTSRAVSSAVSTWLVLPPDLTSFGSIPRLLRLFRPAKLSMKHSERCFELRGLHV